MFILDLEYCVQIHNMGFNIHYVQMWLTVSPILYILYTCNNNTTLKMAVIPAKTFW